MKVLFVDDERGLLEQAKIFLERMVDDLVLDTELSAVNAVEHLDGNTYDAVISDYQMPRMDGLDLLETIREKKGMDIPFIIFTGKGREEVAIEALNLGANRYLQKGGDPKSQYSLLADAVKQEIELHQTKTDLESRKKQFERAVKLAPYPAMLHAEDGEIILINDTWTDITGYEIDDIPKIDEWTEKAYGDEGDSVEEHISNLFGIGGRVDEGVYTITTKTGEKRKWDFSSSPLGKLPDGRRLILSMANDITEREKIESELRESEKKYQAITEKSHDAIFVLGKENLIFVNDKVKELTGYSKEEILDMNWWELLHPDDRQKVRNIDTKGRMGQDVPTKYEAKILTKNGEVKYGDFRVTPIEYEGKMAVMGTIRDITEQKRKEEELKEERNLLEQIAETSPVCITKVDKNGQIVYANDRAEDVLGLSKGDIDGMTYNDVKWKITDYDGNDFPEEELPFNRVREEKRSLYDIRHAIEWPDGERKFLSINASPIFDETEFDGMVATIEDITEKVIKERELKESRRRLKTLMNNIPGMAYRCLNDRDWTMVFLSEGCYELTGYHPEELSKGGSISYAEVIHPEHRDHVWEEVQNAVEMDEPFKLEYKIVTASGKTKWVWEKGRKVISDGEEYIEGIITDITDQKEKENELEKGKRRYETLFEENPEAIVEVDEDFKIIKVNSPFEKLFKYDEEELLGKYLDDIVVPEDMMDEAEELNEKSSQKGYFDHETVRVDKYGEKIPVSITGRPIKHGGETHHLAVYRDISERKEVEKREDFLHSLLRHDVRNKAQLANGYLELMEDEFTDEKGYLKKAERAVREAEEIIDKVSKLRKVEKKEEIEEVDLDSVLDKVLSKYQGQIDEHGIDIEIEKCGCKVKGGTLLEELFSNIMENSIKHSKCSEIRMVAVSKEDGCLITIEDDGIGIPDRYRDRIFDKGFKEGEKAGSGLGLYMAKEIVESYDGKIDVADSDLDGTRFDIHLKKISD